MLIKVRNSDDMRERILETAKIFRGKIIDLGEEAISIEVTGDSSKIDGFIQNVKSFGIIEMCRTGIVALDRGSTTIWSDHDD